MKTMRFLTPVIISLLMSFTMITATEPTRAANNICLVVAYTTSSYSTLPSLKTLYSGMFANVVFYGPTQYAGVNQIDINNGITAYVAIADAMQRYPNYSGYLMIFNYRYLSSSTFQNTFDPNKIWLDNFKLVAQNPGALTMSPWWQGQAGLEAAQNVLNALSTPSASQYTINCGQNVPVSAGSMIYFPARVKDQVKQLSDLCYQFRLNGAVAYPLIALCIESKSNIQYFGTSVPWR